jgi:MSHA biogenesis protein MshP
MSTRKQHGFTIVAAIFILVVLAALAGFIVSMTTTQSLTLAQDFQAARAYQAARAGVEWGISRWLNANTCTNSTAPHITFTDPDLTGFTAVVTASPTPGGGKNFCTITATATPTGAVAGSTGFVERQLITVVEGN